MLQESSQSTPWRLHGASDPKFIAGGHSHVFCMLSSLIEGGTSEIPAAVAYSASLTGGVPNDPTYWDFLVDSAKGRTAVIVWNGNQHQAAFLISPDPALRVYHAAVPKELYDDGGDGIWIPQTLFRSYWDWTYKDFIELLERLQANSRVFVLGTPPPKTEPMIREVLEAEPTFVNHAQTLGLAPIDLRLTAPHTRLAMWNVIQDDMRAIATSAGAHFVAVPARLRDHLGFLRPEYSVPDATHANSAYGLEMWREAMHLDEEAVNVA